jgi:hypothetical protein
MSVRRNVQWCNHESMPAPTLVIGAEANRVLWDGSYDLLYVATRIRQGAAVLAFERPKTGQ